MNLDKDTKFLFLNNRNFTDVVSFHKIQSDFLGWFKFFFSWWRWKRRVKKLAKNSAFKKQSMAFGPITSWQIDAETMETVKDWAPKSLQMMTAAMKLKDICLLLGRKAMTNLDSVLKSRDITLLTNIHI